MSYCRWSSDDYMCDLYCYEDVSGGWTTHVATQKRDDEPIGLPYDGETFNDATLEGFRDRIVMLKEVGYNVPDYVLDVIDKEIEMEGAA